MHQEQTIRSYFRCWLDKDSRPLPELFAEHVVYSECYGPEYHGLAQILAWFSDWNRDASVLKWEIKSMIHQGRCSVVEWYFECLCHGRQSGFDGVSLVEFDEAGKIVSLKEFQSKAEHVFPYGE